MTTCPICANWSKIRRSPAYRQLLAVPLPADSTTRPRAAGQSINHAPYRVPHDARNLHHFDRTAVGLARRRGAGQPPPSKSTSSAAASRSAIDHRRPGHAARPARPDDALGRQIAEVISSDLRSTGAVHAARPRRDRRLQRRPGRSPGLCRVARRRAPAPGRRLCRGAADGRITVACYCSTTSRAGASSPARASPSRPPTGAARRTNAPTSSMRG